MNLRKAFVGNTHWNSTVCEGCGKADRDWSLPKCRPCREALANRKDRNKLLCSICMRSCANHTGSTLLFGDRAVRRCDGCRDFFHLETLKSGRCRNCASRVQRIASLPRDCYDKHEIADRDSWTCGICDGPIDSSITDIYDPGYLNIDHIIPVTAPNFPGDIRSNVQASHRGCNISKGGYKL